jgi:hypothetical protein
VRTGLYALLRNPREAREDARSRIPPRLVSEGANLRLGLACFQAGHPGLGAQLVASGLDRMPSQDLTAAWSAIRRELDPPRPSAFARFRDLLTATPGRAPSVRASDLAMEMIMAEAERQNAVKTAYLGEAGELPVAAGPQDAPRPAPRPAVPSPTPAPSASPRTLNAWIDEGEPPPRPGQPSTLWLDIGAPRHGALASRPFAEPDWGDRESLPLMLVVRGPHVRVEPAVRRGTLPRRGSMEPVPFTIVPGRRAAVRLTITVFLADTMSLLEQYEVAVPVPIEAPERVSP